MKYSFSLRALALTAALASLAITQGPLSAQAAPETSKPEPLISEEIIARQLKATEKFTLKNGIEVWYRQIENSPILQIQLSFDRGYSYYKNTADKAAFKMMMEQMAGSAKGYSREQVFALSQKYSSGISCSASLEVSSCVLGSVNEFYRPFVSLFRAVLRTPTFDRKNLTLAKQQNEANLKRSVQNHGAYINDLVNRVFYPKGHPYRLGFDDELKALPSITRAKLKRMQKEFMAKTKKQVTVVGSLPSAQVKEALEQMFGGLGQGTAPIAAVPAPKYDAADTTIFEHRDIPTGYLRVKFNAPGVSSPERTAFGFMMKILDEELAEEVRTKRGLSYSVYGYYLPYSTGLALISASTSKPHETLVAINDVVDKMKNTLITPSKLEEFKTVYSTNYFLTLETHGSLASALASHRHYDNDAEAFYRRVAKLSKVTPEQIRDLARRYLKNGRLAVLYHKDKYDQKKGKAFLARMDAKKVASGN